MSETFDGILNYMDTIWTILHMKYCETVKWISVKFICSIKIGIFMWIATRRPHWEGFCRVTMSIVNKFKLSEWYKYWRILCHNPYSYFTVSPSNIHSIPYWVDIHSKYKIKSWNWEHWMHYLSLTKLLLEREIPEIYSKSRNCLTSIWTFLLQFFLFQCKTAEILRINENSFCFKLL